MHILVAPNAFKNSLDAGKAAEAICKGFQQSRLLCTTTCFPVGDGGDGTAALLLRYMNGTTVSAAVHDPLGRIISSSFGLTDDN
ncbi:MAG TPA: glycerate kinase, partial [Panacibacter sp.]|nr:glycerate kinase [Panacibacter sp.]